LPPLTAWRQPTICPDAIITESRLKIMPLDETARDSAQTLMILFTLSEKMP
jgi:hypothetical protein